MSTMARHTQLFNVSLVQWEKQKTDTSVFMIVLICVSYSSNSLTRLSNKESTKGNRQLYFGLNYIIFSCVSSVR